MSHAAPSVGHAELRWRTTEEEDGKTLTAAEEEEHVAELVAWAANHSSDYATSVDHLHAVQAVVRSLKQRGALVQSLRRVDSQRERTPLHWAAYYGTADLVRLLALACLDDEAEGGLGRDALNLNAKDKKQRTPLHLACLQGRIETAMQLLELGASVDAQDVRGRRPIDYIEHADDVKRLRQQYRVSQIMNPKMRGWCLARLLLDAKRQADDAVRAPHGSPTRSRTISADSALAPRASILTAEMPRRTTLFAGTRALPPTATGAVARCRLMFALLLHLLCRRYSGDAHIKRQVCAVSGCGVLVEACRRGQLELTPPQLTRLLAALAMLAISAFEEVRQLASTAIAKLIATADHAPALLAAPASDFARRAGLPDGDAPPAADDGSPIPASRSLSSRRPASCGGASSTCCATSRV